MSIHKKNYYLFIENTRDFNLSLIKIRNKFNIIYRNQNKNENIKDLFEFRKNCKKRGVNFFVSNNTKLLSKLNADGLYISSYNKNLLLNKYRRIGYTVIGSAHNYKEIIIKKAQGCRKVVFSRIFETSYKDKKGFLGVLKFNLISLNSDMEIIPLGGINEKNLIKMKSVNCRSFACMSVIKKKPANIINRLF